jgi:hypothetical protein
MHLQRAGQLLGTIDADRSHRSSFAVILVGFQLLTPGSHLSPVTVAPLFQAYAQGFETIMQ